MNIWLAISLILAVVAVYMFMIEVFSVALKLTGLATNKLKFQVASLFTGAGFTTAESELITNDNRRRRIAVACMYTGHIFSVIIMGLVINVFFSIWTTANTDTGATNFTAWYFIVFYVSSGVFLLVLFIKIPPINKRFQRLLENIAINVSSRSRHTNIVTAIDYYGRSAVVEVILNRIPDFINELTLREMELTKKYSFIILSIKRGARRITVTKDTMLVKGDLIVAYGLISDIRAAFVDSLGDENKNDTIVIDRSNEIQLVNNYGENSLTDVYVEEVPKEIENTKIKDTHLNDRFNITVAVIKRNDEYIFVNKDTIIQKGDTVTLFGPYKNIKLLFNIDKTKGQ